MTHVPRHRLSTNVCFQFGNFYFFTFQMMQRQVWLPDVERRVTGWIRLVNVRTFHLRCVPAPTGRRFWSGYFRNSVVRSFTSTRKSSRCPLRLEADRSCDAPAILPSCISVLRLSRQLDWFVLRSQNFLFEFFHRNRVQ